MYQFQLNYGVYSLQYQKNTEFYDSVCEDANYDVDNKKIKTYIYTFHNYGKTKFIRYENFSNGRVTESTYEYSENWLKKQKIVKSKIYGDLVSEAVLEYHKDGFYDLAT